MTKITYVGGKITERIGGKDTWYAKEDIVFNSQKTITITGKEGVSFGKPLDPPEVVIEKSEYKLESKFAMEQLFEFAKKDSKAMFCFWMAQKSLWRHPAIYP